MNRYSLLPLALLALAACTAKTSPVEGDKSGPLAFASGPSPKDTAAVATGDLFPSMSVTSDDAGIHVWAAFLYTIDDFLPLGAGDTLTATVDGVTRTLESDFGDSHAHYTTTFPPSATGTNVVISLQRTNGQPSAPNNVVVLGAPFTLAGTGPVSLPATAPPQQFDFNALYDVAMTPPPAPEAKLEYSALGPCVPRVVETPHDALFVGDAVDGRVAIDLPNYLDPQTTDCSVAITLDVRTQGTWDPALRTDPKADVLEGSQRRVVDVMVAPTPVAAADGK